MDEKPLTPEEAARLQVSLQEDRGCSQCIEASELHCQHCLIQFLHKLEESTQDE